ncbi:MAG TPA: sulfurtransferase TusA family protein [Verrucomicrobiae bacterium]|nr:sulfurtransferase TusA family protein [Verrucomicrobiae bacterium]
MIAERWNAGEMGCGELLIELALRMKSLAPGQLFELTALDPGAVEDIPAWCKLTRHALVSAEHPIYVIRRRDD